jgi:hypothetical protein
VRLTELAWVVLVVAAHSPTSAAGADAVAPSARLESAFARRYDCDLTATMHITLRGRGGRIRTRQLVTAAKRREGRLHSIGRFTQPAHLRGMALLSVESIDGADQMFVFLPSLGRVRRIGGARQHDSFMGSDLAWSDFERHRARDYRVLSEQWASDAPEPARWVVTHPKRDEPQARVSFLVALSDDAILRVEHGLGGEIRRRLEMPRASILERGTLRIPSRIDVSDLRRGTRTTLEIRDIVVDPELDDRLFSVVTLETGRTIPGEPGRGRSRAD